MGLGSPPEERCCGRDDPVFEVVRPKKFGARLGLLDRFFYKFVAW